MFLQTTHEWDGHHHYCCWDVVARTPSHVQHGKHGQHGEVDRSPQIRCYCVELVAYAAADAQEQVQHRQIHKKKNRCL